MSARKQTRNATALLSATGVASANVITARMLAFSNPATALSPWHQSEAKRMTDEKLKAAGDGMLAATAAISVLPHQMARLGMRPSTWTPIGWMGACQEMADLWMGVGNAALRPATQTVVRNQKRLARNRR